MDSGQNCAMENKGLEHSRQKLIARLKYLIRAVKPYGYKSTSLATAAGLPPSTINRKLSGTDLSLMKPETLGRVEEAASKIVGKPLGSGEALMSELDATNHEIAQSIDDLVQTLVRRKVLREEDLPEHLRASVSRRRQLLELLGLPTA